jgi:hypothetical protein
MADKLWALLARSFISFYSHWINRPEHRTSAPFYGAVTFGPGAALQRGGFWRMSHGLVSLQ